MDLLLINFLKLGLKILYAPLKLLKTKNQIVYLSRQSDVQGLDMKMLEDAIREEYPELVQVSRLNTIGDGFVAKLKYCATLICDMYYLATSKVAIVDTYSIPVSCLKHKKDLKVVQMWHALGAIKKFGLQAVGTKEGRDEKVSRAMCMHKNYDYVIAPSAQTAKFYMEAFGVDESKIKLCPLPRVDFLTDGNSKASEFFYANPAAGQKKLVLYLPTFRDRESYITEMLKTEFEDKEEYQFIISTHPLSKTKPDERFVPNGDFTTEDLIKLADIVITDYSACAFEAALLMKQLYFFVPDYAEYIEDRGINIDLKAELPNAAFEDAGKLFEAIDNNAYDMDSLFAFKEKYIGTTKNNAATLAKFIVMLVKE
ncbi:MAG: CDP-glycerol glycerophosphotransferase family protein [Eubacterium sp.]|nr:CDP-glycerol glycerophosphotransferase family protein [Eubacterium sp.]